jgi:hypothetical protein
VGRFDGLPGAEHIERGLEELERGVEGIGALLVAIGAPRLARAGIDVPPAASAYREPELRLYALLGELGPRDPYSQYNALLRELVSFERALEHRVRKEREQGS